MAFPVTAVV